MTKALAVIDLHSEWIPELPLSVLRTNTRPHDELCPGSLDGDYSKTRRLKKLPRVSMPDNDFNVYQHFIPIQQRVRTDSEIARNNQGQK